MSKKSGSVEGAFILVVEDHAKLLRNIAFLLKYWMTVGIRPAEGLTLTEQHAPKLAYAFPVLTGVLVTLWLR